MNLYILQGRARRELWYWRLAGPIVVAAALQTIGCSSARADDLLERLAGRGVPDFTVVYNCSIHNRLQGAKREEISAQVERSIQDTNQGLARAGQPPVPSDEIRITTNAVMNRIEFEARNPNVVLSIAAGAGRLIATTNFNGAKFLQSTIYDGRRTLLKYEGADAFIYSGFHYNGMRAFVFPGCGVSSIPMCRNLVRDNRDRNMYTGEVVFDDGVPGREDLPAYVPGIVRTAVIYRTECVTETESRNPGPGSVQQRVTFADYRRATPGLLLPGKIQVEESYMPGHVLPFGKQCTLDYTLQESDGKSPPDSAFDFQKQLNTTGLLSDTTRKGSPMIRYEPGKSIESQFNEAAENQRRAKIAALKESRPRASAGILGLIAVILAAAGWYVYRRASKR